MNTTPIKSRSPVRPADLRRCFEAIPTRVLTPRDLEQILNENGEGWGLGSVSPAEFVAKYGKITGLRRVEIPVRGRPEIERFLRADATPHEVALSLRPRSYLCHYTAMALHELTEQVPKTIYVNAEQTAKRDRPVRLSQADIDAAFAKPMRVTHNVTVFEGRKLFLLESRHTGQAGVTDWNQGEARSPLRVTGIERTLIDCAVRPLYSGGVFEVLKAFETARERDQVSARSLAALLGKLAFIYPYHQVLGFYMERLSESALCLMEKFETRFDFHLTYDMRERAFSPRWRLWIPKSLE